MSVPQEVSFPNEWIYSPFCEAVNGRALRETRLRNNADMLSAHGLLHNRMARSVSSLYRQIGLAREQLSGANAKVRSIVLLDTAEQFQDTAYRAFELVEFYRRVPDYLSQHVGGHRRKIYLEKIDQETRYISTICNGIKHNNCVLNPVICHFDDGGCAIGVSFCSYTNGVYRCMDLGAVSRVISFENTLVRIVRSLFRCDQIAADLVSASGHTEGELISTPYFCLPYRTPLRELATLDTTLFPMESRFGVCKVVNHGDNFDFTETITSLAYQGPCSLEFFAIVVRPNQSFSDPFDGSIIGIKTDAKLVKFDHLHMSFTFNYEKIEYVENGWRAQMGAKQNSVNLDAISPN